MLTVLDDVGQQRRQVQVGDANCGAHGLDPLSRDHEGHDIQPCRLVTAAIRLRVIGQGRYKPEALC
jgi:hypothetical protein